MNDELGDRMKIFEGIEANRILIPKLPIMIRLDGKSFHVFCRGLKRPYDKRFSDLMIKVTKALVNETNAIIAHTSSDEISLALYTDKIKSQLFFNGRIQKIISVTASIATAYFNKHLPDYIPEKASKLAFFDCRVWNVPSLEEACNTFMWRELDASKNSISMAGQSVYSHKELQHKHSGEIQEMLFQKGINWNDYPSFFKRGSYIRRIPKAIKFSTAEIDKLPAKHLARTNPDLLFERQVIETVEYPPLNKVTNRVDVLFKGAEPKTLAELPFSHVI
jgi:tRNA(His) 5'-end guanylyltransferase